MGDGMKRPAGPTMVEFVMIAALVAGGVIVLALIFEAQLSRYVILSPQDDDTAPAPVLEDDGADS